MAINVVGRYFPNPVVQVTPGTINVAIRIEDARNPEPWVELFITWEDLDKLRAAALAGLSVDQVTAEPLHLGNVELPELPPPEVPEPPPNAPNGQK
jgi:hypothetical protein